MDNLYYNLFVGQLHKTLLYCLYRTLYVSLDNQRQLFYITCLDLAEQIIQRQLGFGILKQLVFAFCNESLCIGTCFLLVFCRHQHITCARNVIQSQDLNRHGRACLFYAASLIIHHCADLTVAGAGCYIISNPQSTLLYQNGSYRSFSFIKLCLNNKTSCLAVGVRL